MRDTHRFIALPLERPTLIGQLIKRHLDAIPTVPDTLTNVPPELMPLWRLLQDRLVERIDFFTGSRSFALNREITLGNRRHPLTIQTLNEGIVTHRLRGIVVSLECLIESETVGPTHPLGNSVERANVRDNRDLIPVAVHLHRRQGSPGIRSAVDQWALHTLHEIGITIHRMPLKVLRPRGRT